jgi:Na+/H+-dicarboxylate symporter
VSFVGFFLLLVIAGVMENSIDGGVGADETIAAVIGLLYFLIIAILLIGLGLGIAGLCQKNRQKVFAILGVVFVVITLILAILVLLIGIFAM